MHEILNKTLIYRFIKLFAFLILGKDLRKQYRTWCNDKIFISMLPIIKKRYKKHVKNLSKLSNKRKLRVAFLVSDIAKWKAQSLFDLMNNSDSFNPFIAVTTPDAYFNKTTMLENFENIFNYFNDKGIETVKAFDTTTEKAIDLKNFSPDIVFYQQPWYLHKIQQPNTVSKYAITCYIPYFVTNYGDLELDCGLDFHKCLLKHYVLNKTIKTLYNDYIGEKSGEFVASGHTMLDNLYLNKNSIQTENFVIYAPHFSIMDENNPKKVTYATFEWNGIQILDYAKQHPEIKWVFKPHPLLKDSLKSKESMTTEEIENYYTEWERIAITSYNSDYFELFLKSKALITDCGSFLIEYFSTGKPIIHLISADCNITPIAPSQKIFDTFYKARNLEDMYKYFEQVIIKNEDNKLSERVKLLEQLDLSDNYAAQNIIDDLTKTIKG